MNVLVLNIDYSPLGVIPWRDAMEKLVTGKVELLEAYAGRLVRSVRQDWPFPAVVRLITGYTKRRIRLSRAHILARDAYTCGYCGARPRKAGGAPRLEELTIDHVVPRAQARNGRVRTSWTDGWIRVTSWENVTTACYDCNAAKADKTPEQAGMVLRRVPRQPTTLDIAWMSIVRYEIPTEWEAWLPAGSPWRGYWTAELE